MLDYNDVIAILTVDEYRNFSKAAQVLYMGQPALSKKIHGIEKMLGYEIFVRSRGQSSVEISEQGRELLPILNKIKQLNDKALDIKNSGQQFQIKIATSDGPYLTVIDSAIEKLIKMNKKMTFNLKNMHYKECVDAISNDITDVAFIGSHIHHRHVNILPFYEEHMVFICRSGLIARSTVDPAALDPSQGIYSSYSFEFSLWFKSIFNNRRALIHCDLISQVKRFIETLDLWSIVPYSVAKYIGRDIDISICQLTQKPPNRLIYYAIKPTNINPAVYELMNCIRVELRNDENISLFE